MKTLDVITGWMNSEPNELEINKVENLINRMMANRSKRELYTLESKYRKLLKVEKELKSVMVPVPTDLVKSIKDIEKRVKEVKRDLPETSRTIKKDK